LTTVKPGDGCVTGTHRVAVTAVDRTNPNQVRWLVPEKYGDFYKSELTVDIRGPTKDIVIQLRDDGRAAERVLVEQGDWAPGQK
jgi:hypothetical protein